MSAVASMTGFATVEGTLTGGRSFSLTIKGANHRHLDLSVRLPGGLDGLEMGLRQAVKAEIRRGHVDLTLTLEKAAAMSAVMEVDYGLLESYVDAFKHAAQRLHLNQ